MIFSDDIDAYNKLFPTKVEPKEVIHSTPVGEKKEPIEDELNIDSTITDNTDNNNLIEKENEDGNSGIDEPDNE